MPEDTDLNALLFTNAHIYHIVRGITLLWKKKYGNSEMKLIMAFHILILLFYGSCVNDEFQ